MTVIRWGRPNSLFGPHVTRTRKPVVWDVEETPEGGLRVDVEMPVLFGPGVLEEMRWGAWLLMWWLIGQAVMYGHGEEPIL